MLLFVGGKAKSGSIILLRAAMLVRLLMVEFINMDSSFQFSKGAHIYNYFFLLVVSNVHEVNMIHVMISPMLRSFGVVGQRYS